MAAFLLHVSVSRMQFHVYTCEYVRHDEDFVVPSVCKRHTEICRQVVPGGCDFGGREWTNVAICAVVVRVHIVFVVGVEKVPHMLKIHGRVWSL